MPSDIYSHGHHESVLRSHTWRTAANSAAYLLPRLAPGMALLDVGCGPGTITLDLATHVAPGRVVGIDTVEAPLEVARANAGERTDTTTEFAIGDVFALDFADDTFDVVHAHQVLQHLTDPVAALREMRRVTKPGGIVAARDADYAGMIWYPMLPGLQRWMDLYQRVARANGGEPDAGRRLLYWAQQAGFTDIVPTASTWCFAIDDDRAWWGGMWADRVRDSVFATQAIEREFATDIDIASIRATWQNWVKAPGAWFAIPNGEILCRKPA